MWVLPGLKKFLPIPSYHVRLGKRSGKFVVTKGDNQIMLQSYLH